MSLVSAKRIRNDNFEPEDVDLLLGLVNEYSKDIDNPKIEIKKQVSENFIKCRALIPRA